MCIEIGLLYWGENVLDSQNCRNLSSESSLDLVGMIKIISGVSGRNLKLKTLAVISEQDMVRGMSNQWFILHLALSVPASKGLCKATLQGTSKTPGKKHLCVNRSQKLFPHPKEESLTDQKPSIFCSGVEAR